MAENNVWSSWYSFSDLYEYYGLIDDTNGVNRSRMKLSYIGKTGKPHQDDGFRLRSNPNPATAAHVPLRESLAARCCPLVRGDIGCYWIRIEGPDKFLRDYIGQCYDPGWGISGRLTDHFRKLCSIPDSSPDSSDLTWGDIRGITPTQRFSEASEFIKSELKIDLTDPGTAFFEQYVKVKFIKIAVAPNADKKIHRIEGMAMAAYRAYYGKFPHLNSTDETIGLNGMLEEL
jgi:hypothetical protein